MAALALVSQSPVLSAPLSAADSPFNGAPPSNCLGARMVASAPAFTSVPAPLMCEQRSDALVLEELFRGLRASPKHIDAQWSRDERGAALHDRLCAAPEYYLARAELRLIDANAERIAQRIGPSAALIEFGGGTHLSARVLLDELAQPAAYVPVDVARTPLVAASRALAARFPDIRVLPVCADVTRVFMLPTAVHKVARRVVYLSGAALGHFVTDQAIELLRLMHAVAGPEGALLVGIDLPKEREVLERAYDDAGGVSAALNRNALRHLNQRFGANFDPRRFAHHAVWVEAQSRIETSLSSDCDQVVCLGGQDIAFATGERVLMGYHHKPSPEHFASMADEAGLAVRDAWTDEQWRFSVQLLEPAANGTPRELRNPKGRLLLPGRIGSAPAF
jgi:dimethylhistidine N-methyltransferase